MRILYYLITHKNSRQIQRLVDRLSSTGGSFVLIHHDPKSPPLTIVPNDNMAVIEDPVDVRWAGISLVYAMWKGIEWIYGRDFSYDWMIFLSGQDYPVRKISEIERELRQTETDAYVHHERIHENASPRERYFQALCRQRYFFRRVKIPGVRALFFKRKHPYVDGLRCFAGSQWLNLSRRAVDSLWSRRVQARSLMDYLRNASCPDETVFQTLLRSDSGLSIENNDKRYVVWQETADSPETLTLADLDGMVSSDAWFARKVDDAVCAELLDRLDEMESAGGGSRGSRG